MAFRTATQAVKDVAERTKPSAKGAKSSTAPKKVNSLRVMSVMADAMTPDQKYIQDGLRDGTITKQLVGMRSIIVDTAFQARIPQPDTGKFFSMSHVRDLAAARDINDGLPLAPIVLFLNRKTGKYYIGDGFHRHEENRQRGYKDILAFVVDVEDWEHECRLFASMCNRKNCLPRRDEDRRKAVEMLLADPECWKWSNLRVSKHCGTSNTLVAHVRVEYSQNNNIEIPEKAIDSSGREVKRNRTPSQPQIYCETHKGKQQYRYNTKGGKVNLGRVKDKAETRLAQILESETKSRASLDIQNIKSKCITRSIFVETANTLGGTVPNVRGLKGSGFVLTTADFRSDETVPWAVGCVQMLREITGTTNARMVVICYPEDGPKSSIQIARQIGIEFLTPDELVASLKGE